MVKIGIRVWILIIFLALALLAISPSFDKGVVIKSVGKNSTAFNEGLRQTMIIKSINGEKVETLADYTNAIEKHLPKSNNSVKFSILTDAGEFVFLSGRAPEITVAELPRSNIKLGLDLNGGARALVKTVNVSLSASEVSDLVAVMSERFNVYGISDTIVRPVKDLEGNNFVLIEISGATPDDLEALVAKQGKFEAKIGNLTVFKGGNDDISSVCRNDATCAAITQCDVPQQGGYFCNFRFTLYLHPSAAERHALLTKNLSIDETGQYLSEKLNLFIDDSEVDSLLISKDLRGQATTQISIEGSGTGTTYEVAYSTTQESMRRLQTVLITGSLPYQLEIIKLDTISPLLGREFTKSLINLAIVVFICVSIVLFIKYRKIKVTLSVILTMISEVILTLGFAALVKWNLDAPSIAGIIAGLGTGVNDQIVIIDESVSNRHESIKERIKRALFIIFGAFLTIVAAMIPLFGAGAGLLRGFAFTTIVGVTMGILITRPAFAEIIRKMEE